MVYFFGMRWIVLALFFAAPAFAEPQEYDLLPDKKAISFTYEFDDRMFTGYFPSFNGELFIDWKQASRSSINVEIDTLDATAGFIFATQTLRGPEVLWSREFPKMSFTSTDARLTETGVAIDGELTIRDVTKPVTLDVRLFRDIDSAIDERDNLRFVATTKLNRSEFGADGYHRFVSDELNITINAEIRRLQ